VIYLKSILAGIAALAAFNILFLAVFLLSVIVMGGYWGFGFSLAGLGTPAGHSPLY